MLQKGRAGLLVLEEIRCRKKMIMQEYDQQTREHNRDVASRNAKLDRTQRLYLYLQ